MYQAEDKAEMEEEGEASDWNKYLELNSTLPDCSPTQPLEG